MSTNNKVFQVLPTKGNVAMLAATNTVADLAEGQIGIFDADTNISVDAASLAIAKPKSFYIAVGIPNGEVAFSAGQSIQVANVRDVTLDNYVAGVDQVIDIRNFTAENDTTYGIKLELRNIEIYMRQGINQFTKPFTVNTSADLSVEPIQDLGWKLYNEMLLDDSGLFSVKLIDSTDHITDISVKADYDAWVVLNPGVAPDIRITADSLALMSYMGINPRYYFPRQTIILPSIIAGFVEPTDFVEVTAPVAEQGNAYDIKQKMYKAGGWNGKPGPYRTSSHLGYPYAGVADAYFNSVDGAHYMQLHIVNDFFSTAGWGEYLNNCQTTVAIPTADAATSAPVIAAINLLCGTAVAL